jgi:hypothetical protein
MSPLYTRNGKLLVSNGALATSINCCCESSSSSSSSSGGGEGCDCVLITGGCNSIVIEVTAFNALGQTAFTVGGANPAVPLPFQGAVANFVLTPQNGGPESINVQAALNCNVNPANNNQAQIELNVLLNSNGNIFCDANLVDLFFSSSYQAITGGDCNEFGFIDIRGFYVLNLINIVPNPCQVGANIGWTIADC